MIILRKILVKIEKFENIVLGANPNPVPTRRNSFLVFYSYFNQIRK